MKLEFATEKSAQALCDRMHDWMLANDINYAASVASGQTTAWAKPFQVKDEKGKVLNPAWCVTVKPKCMGALTAQEKSQVK